MGQWAGFDLWATSNAQTFNPSSPVRFRDHLWDSSFDDAPQPLRC